jgi:hypothetical protein
MKIGFFNNQIDERSSWQAYYFAKYARIYLGHTTAIYYPETSYQATLHPQKRNWIQKWLGLEPRDIPKTLCDQKMAGLMIRDGIPVIGTRLDADFSDLDALYHFKSGERDGFMPRGTRYWVHVSFNGTQPHGDRYVALGQWLGLRDGLPFVPFIVEVADDQTNMRRELGLPEDAFVFGRFGGYDSFDIRWVWEAIKDILERYQNVYFLFANTQIEMQHGRVISLPALYDEVQKRRFINSCDAMLHARARGETFGVAVGEFACCGKPVLTYAGSPELAHIELLSHPLCFNEQRDLIRLMEKGIAGEFPKEDGGHYRDCTPKKVMAMFDQNFIR